jgi:hypothetical protein
MTILWEWVCVLLHVEESRSFGFAQDDKVILCALREPTLATMKLSRRWGLKPFSAPRVISQRAVENLDDFLRIPGTNHPVCGQVDRVKSPAW